MIIINTSSYYKEIGGRLLKVNTELLICSRGMLVGGDELTTRDTVVFLPFTSTFSLMNVLWVERHISRETLYTSVPLGTFSYAALISGNPPTCSTHFFTLGYESKLRPA